MNLRVIVPLVFLLACIHSCRTGSSSDISSGILRSGDQYHFIFTANDGKQVCSSSCSQNPQEILDVRECYKVCSDKGLAINADVIAKGNELVYSILKKHSIAYDFSSQNDDGRLKESVSELVEKIKEYGVPLDACSARSFLSDFDLAKTVNEVFVEGDFPGAKTNICTSKYSGLIFSKYFVENSEPEAKAACRGYAGAYEKNCKSFGCFKSVEKVAAKSKKIFEPGQFKYAYRRASDLKLVTIEGQIAKEVGIGCFAAGTMILNWST